MAIKKSSQSSDKGGMGTNSPLSIFRKLTSKVRRLISVLTEGPFKSYVTASSTSVSNLAWKDVPGTRERYRVALARTEVNDSEDDLCLRIYLQQRYSMGIAPTESCVDATVQIVGRSSVTGNILDTPESVWKFAGSPGTTVYHGFSQVRQPESQCCL